MTYFYAFTTGFTLGIIFAILKLPIPAPQHLAGVIGIVGIFVGYFIIQYLKVE